MNYTNRGFTLFLLLSLFVLLATGCSKDLDEPNDPLPAQDEYVGIHKILTYIQETVDLHEGEFTCYFRTEKNEIITRVAHHSRREKKSTLSLRDGLKEGTYEFLRMEYEKKQEDATIRKATIGFGAQIQVDAKGITNIRNYDSSVGFFGSGTKENPYIISADNHLLKLASIVNDPNKRKFLKDGSFFLQTDDIDMEIISFESDNKYGWRPIGKDPGLPFIGSYDGGGYSLTGMNSTRPGTTGVGLFGYVCHSVLQNIVLQEAMMQGNGCVAALAGNVVTYGNERARTIIRNCRVEQSHIKSGECGVGIGGLLGATDGNSLVFIDSCYVDKGSKIEGDIGIGGLIGMGLTTSSMFVSNSVNHAEIHANNTGVGGIIGLADTLAVAVCSNYGNIQGAKIEQSDQQYGAGGIVGGSGNAIFAGCSNFGTIKGDRGVGGIVGSTLISAEENIYNSIAIQACENSGKVEAIQYAGGLCGEAQGMISDSHNNNSVLVVKDYVGGIIGYLPGGSIYQVSNFGTISGKGKCGGISGKTDLGIIGIANNFGKIQADGGDCVGGILGMGGSSNMIHYCSNFASVNNPDGTNTAGIVGMIGDVRKWDALDIATLVMGTIDILGGFLNFASIGIGEITNGLKIGLYTASVLTSYTNLIGDLILYIVGGKLTDYNLSTESTQWAEVIKTTLTDKAMELDGYHDQAIGTAMDQWSIDLDENFDETVITTHFKNNIFNLKSFYTNSKDNGANSILFNDNINTTRDKKGALIIKNKNKKSWLHSIASGICIGVSTIIFAASILATVISAGTSVTVTIAVIGSLTAFIGGINSITQACTDFAENVCIVDQCVNAGNIIGGDKTAGLVGSLEQNCTIENCLNIGNNNETSPAFAHIYEASNVVNCLNLGMKWKKVVGTTSSTVGTVKGCYSLSNSNTDLSRCTQLDSGFNKTSTFDGWSINEQNTLWQIPDITTGSFPIPYYSQMQKKTL